MSLTVPSCTFHVHAKDKATILRRLSDGGRIGIVTDLEVVAELVDRDLVLTGVILQRTREEGLGEEETGDPESGWGSRLDPLNQEGDPLVQIVDPRGEWLEGEETDGWLPGNWHLVIEH